MSRYGVDKVLRQLMIEEQAAARFRQDAVGFLVGRDLTDEERLALETFDYRALYAMGAHPFLLNAFVTQLWKGDRRSMMQEYRAAVAPLGHPDFST